MSWAFKSIDVKRKVSRGEDLPTYSERPPQMQEATYLPIPAAQPGTTDPLSGRELESREILGSVSHVWEPLVRVTVQFTAYTYVGYPVTR